MRDLNTTERANKRHSSYLGDIMFAIRQRALIRALIIFFSFLSFSFFFFSVVSLLIPAHTQIRIIDPSESISFVGEIHSSWHSRFDTVRLNWMIKMIRITLVSLARN